MGIWSRWDTDCIADPCPNATENELCVVRITPNRLESDAHDGDESMTENSKNRFQVNLGGLIDILANHLYSGPQVYLRELMQNATDAIRARQAVEKDFMGSVRIELIQPESGPPTLVFEDDGIGLTPDEIELFLATVGQSSKKQLIERDVDYIGRFGIGLLSCFMVCDDIVVITRSSRDGGKSLKWEGSADGTYVIETLENDTPVGTQVYIRAKTTAYEYFDPKFVRRTLKRYGGCLNVSIQLEAGGSRDQINATPLWEEFEQHDPQSHERVLALAKDQLGEEFLDVFPVHSTVGKIEGLAFVLRTPSTLASQKSHQVYLKRMLLSDSINNLLPDWAFFVRVVANVEELQPTASRESLVENFEFENAREHLGSVLRQYLMQLAQSDGQRFNVLLAVHHAAIKSLCVEDDECLKLFADWLPFETTLGRMRFKEFREQSPAIRYVPTVDEFRSIKQVAAAQGYPVVNGGYVHDAEILQRIGNVFPDVSVSKFDQSELAEQFSALTLEEQENVVGFSKLVDAVLRPYHCEGEVVKFEPSNLPTMFVTNEASKFLRNVEQTQDSVDSTWGSVLDGLAQDAHAAAYSKLFLNLHNPIVQRVIALEDRECLKTIIEVLYVQSLLLGHHPMKATELRLLNSGVLDLLNRAIG